MSKPKTHAQAVAAANAVFETRVVATGAARNRLSPMKLDDLLHKLEMQYWNLASDLKRRRLESDSREKNPNKASDG